MYDKASLALIPSGTKTGKLYSVLPANDDGDFIFERGTTATRVNKDGLIETVSADIPRLDYPLTNGVVGDCPHLLLEPSSTNVIQNSEITSTWTYTEYGSGSAGTITTGKTDMFGGTNAVQIDFPSDAENVSFTFGQTTSSISSGSVSLSLYIKLVESDAKTLQFRASSNAVSLINVNSTDFVRYEMAGTKNSSEAFNVKLRPSAGTSGGGFSIIVCHPQEEAGSYPTSYIPTNGETNGVTRSADFCINSGTSADINNEEGVLFVESAALADDLTFRQVTLNDGSSNTILIGYRANSNRIYAQLVSNNVSQAFISYDVTDITEFHKIALKYSTNSVHLWIDGVKRASDTSATMPLALNNLDLQGTTGSAQFFAKTKQVIVFNEALSDSELQTLTS